MCKLHGADGKGKFVIPNCTLPHAFLRKLDPIPLTPTRKGFYEEYFIYGTVKSTEWSNKLREPIVTVQNMNIRSVLDGRNWLRK